MTGLHRNLSLLAVAFIAVHVLTAVLPGRWSGGVVLGSAPGPGQRRGLVADEQECRVLGREEMVGQRVAHGVLVMGAAPSRSETDAPDGRGRHGERW